MSGSPGLPSEALMTVSASGSCTTLVAPVGEPPAAGAGHGAGFAGGMTCEAGTLAAGDSDEAESSLGSGASGTIFATDGRRLSWLTSAADTLAATALRATSCRM